MASSGAIWGPAALRLLRHAATRTVKTVRARIADATRPFQGEIQHIPIRSSPAGRQPIHPIARLKQQKRGSRWFSSTSTQQVGRLVRRYLSSESSAAQPFRLDRSKLPVSRTSQRMAQFSGRAPFANTLRPNLTGGAMPRTAGGYSLGGSARYFSHTPAAPAQVVQNVSQAMRAFMVSGGKLRYDGVNARGDRQYRSVSAVEDAAMNKLSAIARTAPGSFISFKLSPTVTALSPLAAVITRAASTSGFHAEAAITATNLNTEGFLDVLSADFGRALKELTTVFGDMQRLSVLGDLPVAMESTNILRVRFPGVDSDTVNRLCDDLGIQSGIVGQDLDFDAAAGSDVALKFPFAPASDKTLTSPGGSARSLTSLDQDLESYESDDSFIYEAFGEGVVENPWLSDTEGYDSISAPISSAEYASNDFEGLEGIHRFLEECDRVQNRFG